jgi:hypothetical protein
MARRNARHDALELAQIRAAALAHARVAPSLEEKRKALVTAAWAARTLVRLTPKHRRTHLSANMRSEVGTLLRAASSLRRVGRRGDAIDPSRETDTNACAARRAEEGTTTMAAKKKSKKGHHKAKKAKKHHRRRACAYCGHTAVHHAKQGCLHHAGAKFCSCKHRG